MGRFHEHTDGHHHDHGHSHAHDHAHDHNHLHDPLLHHTHNHDDSETIRVRFDQAEIDQIDPSSSEHGDHSGYQTGRERVAILKDIFSENDRCAAKNKEAFDANGVECINVMSSPGAGKTTVLEKTLAALHSQMNIGVVEGDIETSLDADRLGGYAAQVSLLNTGNGFGGECHLDAPMVAKALENLDLSELDLVFIENVGNLVCPAEFAVGEHRKVMIYSITEGEDKPLKYPVMFRSVDVILVNKMDLLPHLDADIDLFTSNVRAVNPSAPIFYVSAKTGNGMRDWIDWIITRPTRPNGGK